MYRGFIRRVRVTTFGDQVVEQLRRARLAHRCSAPSPRTRHSWTSSSAAPLSQVSLSAYLLLQQVKGHREEHDCRKTGYAAARPLTGTVLFTGGLSDVSFGPQLRSLATWLGIDATGLRLQMVRRKQA